MKRKRWGEPPFVLVFSSPAAPDYEQARAFCLAWDGEFIDRTSVDYADLLRVAWHRVTAPTAVVVLASADPIVSTPPTERTPRVTPGRELARFPSLPSDAEMIAIGTRFDEDVGSS